MKDCIEVILKYEKILLCDGIYIILKNIEIYLIFC